MRVAVTGLVLCLAALTLSPPGGSTSRAQESAAELAPAMARETPTTDFAARVRAVRAEHITAADGAVAHAERAETRRVNLSADGEAEAAARAERIAETALRLAETIVRRERGRARVLALRSERIQIAYRLERARSVLEHQRALPADFPADPNDAVEDPAP